MTDSERSSKRGFTSVWVFLLIVGGILILGDLTGRMTEARRLERDAILLATEVAELELENAAKRTQIAEAGNDSAIEDWARGEAGMIREGERLVVPLPASEATPASPEEEDPESEPASPWEIWMLLLVGG